MFTLDTEVQPIGFPPVAETLPEAVEKLVKELAPEKIILFGSYAYGNPTPDSDVDLLIILDTNKTRKERVIAVSLLLYPRLFPVDILVKTPQEIEDELQQGNFFLQEVIKNGRILYERNQ